MIYGMILNTPPPKIGLKTTWCTVFTPYKNILIILKGGNQGIKVGTLGGQNEINQFLRKWRCLLKLQLQHILLIAGLPWYILSLISVHVEGKVLIFTFTAHFCIWLQPKVLCTLLSSDRVKSFTWIRIKSPIFKVHSANLSKTWLKFNLKSYSKIFLNLLGCKVWSQFLSLCPVFCLCWGRNWRIQH